MNLQKHQEFENFKRILIGTERIWPEKDVVKTVRYAIENFTSDAKSDKEYLAEFFEIIRSWKEFPITNRLDNLLSASTELEMVKRTLELIEHLFYDIEVGSCVEYFKTLEIPEEKAQEIYESSLSLITYPGARNFVRLFSNFSESSMNPNFAMFLGVLDKQVQNKEIFQAIKKLLLEKNLKEQIHLCLDLYNILYDHPELRQLGKAYEHLMSLQSDLEFFKFLSMATNNNIFEKIRKVEVKFPELNIVDAFSQGQIKSKVWAIETLKGLSLPPPKSLLVLCGWYALFVRLLDEMWPELELERIRSLDIDPVCAKVAEEFNKERFLDRWNFKALTLDIKKLEYTETEEGIAPLLPMENSAGKRWKENLKYDLWVNTSCEHIEDFQAWYESIPSGQLVLLQSNDFFGVDDHVNCVNSVAEFREQTPMTKRLFSGALPLDKYTRYMTIGYK